MRLKGWLDTGIQFLMLLVVSAGLYFAWVQAVKITESIEASNRGIRLANWNTISQQWLEMDKLILENPEVYKYIYNGHELAGGEATQEKETALVEAAARYVLNFADYALVTQEFTTDTQINTQPWADYFRRIFGSSPVICRILWTSHDVYSETTKRIALSSCPNSSVAPMPPD